MVLRRGWTPKSEGLVGGRRKEKEKRGKKEREKKGKKKKRNKRKVREEREGRELCRFSVLKGGLVYAPIGRGLLLPWLVLV